MRAAAHDLANLLTVINGLCEMGRREAARGEMFKAVARLSKIAEVSVDCGEILKRTFFPAADEGVTPGHFELNGIARKIVGQNEDELAARTIEVRLDLGSTDLMIRGDAMAMQRAIFNLVINARNAIGERGTIVISTGQVHAGTAFIQVNDTGRGMSEEELAVIWAREPKGAHGHGLPMVRRTVNQSGGRLEVASKPGSGTKFRISLPLANVLGMESARDRFVSGESSIPSSSEVCPPSKAIHSA